MEELDDVGAAPAMPTESSAGDVDSLTASFDDDDTTGALLDTLRADAADVDAGGGASLRRRPRSTSDPGAQRGAVPRSRSETRERFAQLRLEAKRLVREMHEANASTAATLASVPADTADAGEKEQDDASAVEGAVPRGPGRLRRVSGSILNMLARGGGTHERNMAHYELYAKQLAENPVDQATVDALIVLDRKKRFYKHVNLIDDATCVTAVAGIVLAAAICQITYVRE